jgi:predicted house-cleaning noncanonical NTP pyrophosphatase (MazG superfamily)
MEKRVYYNKLVRDLIKDRIEAKGESCSIRTIDDVQEYQQELLKKVLEEAGALAHTRSREQFLEEYCDLMVVLDSLTDILELSEAEIKEAMEHNIARKGRYTYRHFLAWSADVTYESNETPQGVR